MEPVGNEAAALRVTFRILDCALFHSTLYFIMLSGAGRMEHKQYRMYKYSKVPYSIIGKEDLLKYALLSASGCALILTVGGILHNY